MATYSNYQELKRAEHLENPDRIGSCLTCRFWDAGEARTEALSPTDALCLQPQLKDFQLIVSGGSGCNRWERLESLSPEMEVYTPHGVEESRR